MRAENITAPLISIRESHFLATAVEMKDLLEQTINRPVTFEALHPFLTENYRFEALTYHDPTKYLNTIKI